MKFKIILLFVLAISSQTQGRSAIVPQLTDKASGKDLAADVATALAAVDTCLVDTNQLFSTLSSVDDVLMLQIQVLAGNIILKLYDIGINGTDLQNLQTIINNAEAVIVYQIYLQAYAVIAHRDTLNMTQVHLGNDLSQLPVDRDGLETSMTEMVTGFNTAFDLAEGEVVKFNTAIQGFIQGMSGPEVDDIKNSLALINLILSNTRNDITREKAAMDTSTQTSIDALDVVIAQLPAQLTGKDVDSVESLESIETD